MTRCLIPSSLFSPDLTSGSFKSSAPFPFGSGTGAFLDNVFRSLDTSSTETSFNPTVEVKETPNTFIVHVELAGIKEEDVEVNFDSGVLKISGEKKSSKEEKSDTVYLTERSYGKFVRSFSLPVEKIDEEAISAEFKNGLLEITLPKKEEVVPKAKKIAINSKH